MTAHNSRPRKAAQLDVRRARVDRASRRSRRSLFSCINAIEPLEQRRLLSSGVLDTSFGVDGLVTTDILGAASADAYAVAVQSDGKVLIGGRLAIPGRGSVFNVMRYNADGTVDATFGENGHARTDAEGGSDHLYALAVQPDGRILAGGGGDYSGGGATLVRYLPDGSPDTSFGNAGIVRGALGFGGMIKDIEVLPDGMIVIGGERDSHFVIARYHSGGVLDPTFANGGVTPAIYGRDFSALAVEGSGKIVTVGSRDVMAIVRWNADGSIDNSFDGDGQLYLNLTTYSEAATGVAITSDQKIVVSGMSASHVTLVKLLDDGSFDTTFGLGGVATAEHLSAYALAMVQQADGKFVISAQDNQDFVLARFDTTGFLDATFGTAGVVITDFGTGGETARAVSLAPSGKIVAAGFDFTTATVDAARYAATGQLDTTFGTGGMVSTNIMMPCAVGVATIVQPDGKILAYGGGGGANNGYGTEGIIRYLPNGDLDTTFGVSGIVTDDAGPPKQIALQSDGKIVVLTNTFGVRRYLADGTLDTSFGSNGSIGFAFGPAWSIQTVGDMIVLPDDRICVTGSFTYLVTQGLWYTGFAYGLAGANGQSVYGGGIDLGSNFSEGPGTFGRDPEGRILLAGGASNTSTSTPYVAVYRIIDGTPSSLSLFPVATQTALAGVAGQSDGKVILAGTSLVAGSNFWFTRLTAAGALDSSFGVGGTMTVDFNGAVDELRRVVVDSSDRIVAAGSTGPSGNKDFALLRLSPDGQLDASFGVGGKTISDFGSSHDSVNGLAFQPNGKIVLAGARQTSDGLSYAVARYTADDLAVAAPDLSNEYDNGWSGDDDITNFAELGFDIAGVLPHATLTLFRDGTPVQSLSDVSGGIVRIMDFGPIHDGTLTYTAQQTTLDGTAGPISSPLSVVFETVAPADIEHAFHLNATPMSVTFRWDEDVAVQAHNFSLVNLTTGTTIDASAILFGYDQSTHTATFTFPGFANGVLPDGMYRALLPAGEAIDIAGNGTTSDSFVTFRVLAGDADDNGVIDFSDYALIDFGFNNHLSGWGNGDFDGNGVVNYDDYSLIDFAFNSQHGPSRAIGASPQSPKLGAKIQATRR